MKACELETALNQIAQFYDKDFEECIKNSEASDTDDVCVKAGCFLQFYGVVREKNNKIFLLIQCIII